MLISGVIQRTHSHPSYMEKNRGTDTPPYIAYQSLNIPTDTTSPHITNVAQYLFYDI